MMTSELIGFFSAEFKCHFHASGTVRIPLDAAVLVCMDFDRIRPLPEMDDGR